MAENLRHASTLPAQRAHQEKRLDAALKHNRQAPAVVRGLEELGLLLGDAKARFVRSVIFCVTITLFWPIFVLFSPIILALMVVIVISGNQESQRRMFQHMMGALGIVTLFLLYFGIPALLLQASHGGLSQFRAMIDSGEVGWIELCFFFASFLFLLVIVVYAWVLYESCSLEVAVSLKSRQKFLKKHWKEELQIPDAEKEKVFGVKHGAPVHVDDLLRVLSKYPGWKGSFDAQEEEIDALMSQRSLAASTGDAISPLASGRPESIASSGSPRKITEDGHKLKHIDAVVLSSMDLLAPGESAVVFRTKIWHFLRNLVQHQPLSSLLTTLAAAALRCAIPRLWAWLYLGGDFLPSNHVAKVVVLTFMFSTFFVTSLWLLLFNVARSQYRHNIDQMRLVTALVSVESRHLYMSQVLQVDPEDPDHLELAQGFPFLDLASADNARIWWAIREYAIVDSLDERVDLEVVLGVALIYLMMMSAYLIVDMFMAGHLTAFTIVSFFDLTVVGALVLISLLGCVEVNEMLRSHGEVMLRARHTLWCPEAKVVGMAEAEVSEFLSSDKAAPGSSVNQEALRLHAHLVEKVQHADTLQTLFGYEVTSDNVSQLLVAILCGLGSAVFSIQKAHQFHSQTAAAAVSLARVVAHKVTTAAVPAAGFLSK